MPPYPTWFRGQDDIKTFLARKVFSLQWRFLATYASGQPAMAAYRFRPERGIYPLEVINVFTFRGAEVAAIHAFQSQDVCARFGLPQALSA